MSGVKIGFYLIWSAILINIVAATDYCSIKCQYEDQILNHIVCEHGNNCSQPVVGCINFRNSTLTSEDRTLILDDHNRLRSKVALGKTEYDLKNITASNMNELKWDEELENIALCWVNTCGQLNPETDGVCLNTESGKTGYNTAYKRISVITQDLDTPYILQEQIRGWSDEVDGFSIDSVDSFPDRDTFQWKFRHFSQMIWAETTRVGCARSLYGQYTAMLGCLYSPGGNVMGNTVFKRGIPCSECKSDACSAKYEGLCKMGEQLEKTTQRTLSLEATTMVATTEIIKTVTTVVTPSSIVPVTKRSGGKVQLTTLKTTVAVTNGQGLVTTVNSNDQEERDLFHEFTGNLDTPYKPGITIAFKDRISKPVLKKQVMVSSTAWLNKHFLRTTLVYSAILSFLLLN